MRPATHETATVIYYVRSTDGTRIKIGKTIQIPQRLKELAEKYGDGLELIAVHEGTIRDERAIHKQFDHLRIDGEWFAPAPELMEYIRESGRPWDAEAEPAREPHAFGDTLRGIRKGRDLTATAASALCGINQQQWSDLENNRSVPTYRVLSRIHKGLGLKGHPLFPAVQEERLPAYPFV